MNRREKLKRKIKEYQAELDALDSGIVRIYPDKPFPSFDPDTVNEFIIHDVGHIDCVDFHQNSISFWCGSYVCKLGLAAPNPHQFRVLTSLEEARCL